MDEALRRSEEKGEPFPDPPERRGTRLGHYEGMTSEPHRIVLDGRRSVADLADEIRRVVGLRTGYPLEAQAPRAREPDRDPR